MEMVEAGKHRLTYRDIHGRHFDTEISQVSTLQGSWIDVTKTMIPKGKKAFIKCPKCNADNWTDDCHHMNGYSCDSCMFEILAV